MATRIYDPLMRQALEIVNDRGRYIESPRCLSDFYPDSERKPSPPVSVDHDTKAMMVEASEEIRKVCGILDSHLTQPAVKHTLLSGGGWVPQVKPRIRAYHVDETRIWQCYSDGVWGRGITPYMAYVDWFHDYQAGIKR